MSDANDDFKRPWWTKLTTGLFLTFGIQTVAVIAWLTQMHSDISLIKVHHAEIDRRLDQIDSGGSKAAALLQQRIESTAERHVLMDKEMASLADRQLENTKMLNEMALTAAREIPKIQGQVDQNMVRLKAVEDQLQTRTAIIERFISTQNTISPLQQSIIDGIKSDIVRIEDRVNRIVVVLDQVYNLINEHLRNPDEPRNPANPPLNRTPPRRGTSIDPEGGLPRR